MTFLVRDSASNLSFLQRLWLISIPIFPSVIQLIQHIGQGHFTGFSYLVWAFAFPAPLVLEWANSHADFKSCPKALKVWKLRLLDPAYPA